MSIMTMRASRAAATIGLAAGIAVVAAASPAYAAAGDTSSTGLKCGGLVTCGPFAKSAFPGGPTSNSLVSANVAGLVTTGLINTTAHAGGATASTNTVNATLSGLTSLTATTVSSQCTINPTTGGVSGSSSIVNGVITTTLVPPITLATAPAPNTTVTVVDPAVASVVLNKQTTAADGTLTVDAIFITLANLQTITISESTCTPQSAAIPAASGNGLLIGGGLLGLLGVAVVAKRRPSFLVRRTA